MSLDAFLDNPISHTAPASSWHAIRPWAPTLALAVREVTSVSATFVLSSRQAIDSSLASLGLEAAGENDEEAPSGTEPSKASSVIADALAKGLSVSVNGSAWPRTFIRIDDDQDEAVIIVYALMPGRQYDIELGLAHGGQLRRQVTTEEENEIHSDPESPTLDHSTSSDPHSTPSTSPSRTVPGTPPTVPPQITLEDRLNQLQHTLSLVNQERETLLASLKSARRDAQKADSALRSEIDTLKRTSEKNTAAELRGRQKVLALQEAVKRAQNATKETEEMALEVKAQVPELTKRKEEKEAEHARVKAQADKVSKQRGSLEEKERRRLEAMRAELTGLTNKLERLGGKREKLEKTQIPDLEEKLRGVEKEIEQEEETLASLEMEEQHARAHALPFQRPRHHSGPGTIGRPNPIQRPSADIPQSISSPLWSPGHTHAPTPAHRQGHPHHAQSHTPKAHSFHHGLGHTPTLLIDPQRRASLKTNASSGSSASNLSGPSTSASAPPGALQSNTASSHSSPRSASLTSSSPSPTRTSPVRYPSAAVPATSTLSSRAPAFEPSRSINPGKAGMNGNGHSHSVPVPIQRPPALWLGSGSVGAGRSGSGGLLHLPGRGQGHGH